MTLDVGGNLLASSEPCHMSYLRIQLWNVGDCVGLGVAAVKST